MLRKITHIVLSVFLLVSTTGITFSMHYCGGQLISVSVNKEAKQCCDGSGGCCDNETLHFGIEDDFVSPVQPVQSKITELDIFLPVVFILNASIFLEEPNATTLFADTSPPPPILKRLSLLQTYLI